MDRDGGKGEGEKETNGETRLLKDFAFGEGNSNLASSSSTNAHYHFSLFIREPNTDFISSFSLSYQLVSTLRYRSIWIQNYIDERDIGLNTTITRLHFMLILTCQSSDS